MRRLAALVAVLAFAGCVEGDDTKRIVGTPTTTTVDPAVIELKNRVVYLESELHKSNVDQQDLRRKVDTYVERASRSSSAPRAVAATTRRYTGGVERWRSLVARYPWPVDTALAVMACESGGDPNARNPDSSATGLFQILGGPTDPEANVALAFRMWQSRGWQPWKACI